MDFGALAIFNAVLHAAGWKAAVLITIVVVILIALIRLAPSWFTDRRTRNLAEEADKRAQTAAIQTRIDTKDAMMEKILTNHIAHLEIQLEASREFFAVATERLSSITQEMKEARAQLLELHGLAIETKEDTTVLRDRAH